MGKLFEAFRETFADLIDRDGWVLVDIWAPRCAPCQALMPHVEQLAATHPELTVVKLEAPKARRLCIDLGVRGVPTLLLYRDGEEVTRISHPDLSAKQATDWLAPYLGVAREVN